MQQAIPKLWIFFLMIVIGLIVAILVTEPSSPPAATQIQTVVLEPTRYATYEEMLERGDDAIYVENQGIVSTSILVGFAVFSQPGFIVVYDDNGGVPGTVIGESFLLESGGEHLVVPVEEPLVEDQVYYAMLYHDDGDGRFQVDLDIQVVDSKQSVVLMTFLATSEVQPESGPVQP